MKMAITTDASRNDFTGLLWVILFIFVILKLIGIITWSWGLVLLPLWIWLFVLLCVVVYLLVFSSILHTLIKRRR